jgi:hypothetical protein
MSRKGLIMVHRSLTCMLSSVVIFQSHAFTYIIPSICRCTFMEPSIITAVQDHALVKAPNVCLSSSNATFELDPDYSGNYFIVANTVALGACAVFIMCTREPSRYSLWIASPSSSLLSGGKALIRMCRFIASKKTLESFSLLAVLNSELAYL